MPSASGNVGHDLEVASCYAVPVMRCRSACRAVLLITLGLVATRCSLHAAGLGGGDARREADGDEGGREVAADADGGDVGPDEGEIGPGGDADAGTGGEADADGDVAEECLDVLDCDDGVPCTTDVCDPLTHTCRHQVEAGACDDGIECTTDRCDPALRGCRHEPDHRFCDNGDPCDGEETCDPSSGGCVPGAPPDCDDGVDCTVDFCESGTAGCRNTPDDARCDDGAFCNGAERCRVGVGCVAGTPPTCDDGLACSIDSCEPTAAGGAGACVHVGPDADGDTARDVACGGTDCDDRSAAIHPGADEVCDGVDQDCSGYPDDAAGACSGCTPAVYGGHVYQFCTSAVWWVTARDWCAGVSGYYLVTINDAAENTFLADTAATLRGDGWWIGYNDRSDEGLWIWVHPPSSYTNWAPGQPSSSTEDCGTLNQMAVRGQWNDEGCTETLPYICEHDGAGGGAGST